VKDLDKEGRFTESPIDRLLVDSDLIIDQETGKVYHPGFGNESYDNIEILDSGSAQSSLKILAFSNSSRFYEDDSIVYRNWTMIAVEVWADGVHKPFSAWNGSSWASGVCQ
jgi:hypothetical protein